MCIHIHVLPCVLYVNCAPRPFVPAPNAARASSADQVSSPWTASELEERCSQSRGFGGSKLLGLQRVSVWDRGVYPQGNLSLWGGGVSLWEACSVVWESLPNLPGGVQPGNQMGINQTFNTFHRKLSPPGSDSAAKELKSDFTRTKHDTFRNKMSNQDALSMTRSMLRSFASAVLTLWFGHFTPTWYQCGHRQCQKCAAVAIVGHARCAWLHVSLLVYLDVWTGRSRGGEGAFPQRLLHVLTLFASVNLHACQEKRESDLWLTVKSSSTLWSCCRSTWVPLMRQNGGDVGVVRGKPSIWPGY